MGVDQTITVLCRPKELQTCMQVQGPGAGTWYTIQSTEKVTRRRLTDDGSPGRRHTVYVVHCADGSTFRFAPNANVVVTAHSYYEALNMLSDQILDWPIETSPWAEDGGTICNADLPHTTGGVTRTVTCGETFDFSSPRELLQQLARHVKDIHPGAFGGG
jgi:hypothetical protein